MACKWSGIKTNAPKNNSSRNSNDLKNFVDKMLEKKAEKRPSAKEALELIPVDVLNDMKIKGEKIVIKSKRPFSSAVFANNSNKGNKLIEKLVNYISHLVPLLFQLHIIQRKNYFET